MAGSVLEQLWLRPEFLMLPEHFARQAHPRLKSVPIQKELSEALLVEFCSMIWFRNLQVAFCSASLGTAVYLASVHNIASFSTVPS